MKSTAAVTLMIIFLVASGCATHAPIKHPNLSANLDAQQNRKALNGVDIMARPVHSKSELDAFYDEDLIQYGVLPFHVSLKNNTDRSCGVSQSYALLTGPDGSARSPMTLDEVYSRASKSYLRSAGMGAAFGLIGAIPTLINVALVNDKIKADYESCMIKNGDLVGNGYTEGSIFFDIDSQITSLDGLKLKIGFKSAETFHYADFDLAGAVEKREAAASPNKER
jgi:hypothetical protein